MDTSKEYGRIYTPNYLVKIILNYGGYNSVCDILEKHIIDNSCGDGAFLTEIVTRYCDAFYTLSNNTVILKQQLETYIHGIEIDVVECEKCKNNLDKIANSYGLVNVKWDILNADTLTVTKYNGLMDYVFGNPPYVRVHNLESNYKTVKQYLFSQNGMTDLFIVFFEIGFRMMAKTGKMCLITPISWLTSVAGNVLRQHILAHKCLNGVIDLAHYQAFPATTYTLISRFSNKSSDFVEYNKFNENQLDKEFICNIPLSEMHIGNSFYLGNINSLRELKKIRQGSYPQKVRVKNGFATLADSVFIGDWSFSGMMIDVVKSSTGKWHKCIFPYNEKSKPISLQEIANSYPDVYLYYQANKDKLCKDVKTKSEKQLEKQATLFELEIPSQIGNEKWHLFGRSQAINDVNNDKIAINSVIKDVNSIKLTPVCSGKGVYGGLYLLSSIDFRTIKSVVLTNEYVSYIAMLKNYKSGGYYTCSGKDIELYINYKLAQNEQQ